jgi:pimeloyl-ACP methyl ester carboxylesterase
VAPFLRGYAPTGFAPDGAYQSGAIAADACALGEILAGDGQSVIVGHDWGGFAAYGAAVLRPERFSKIVGIAVPPVAAAASTFFTFDQIKRSFYVFFFQSPFAEGVVGANNCEFIDRLWADWSPGYDATWDLARTKESIGSPENLSAAISYYRAMLDPTLHVAAYEEAQQACAGIPTQPLLYLQGSDDGCLRIASGSLSPLLSEDSEVVEVAGTGHFLHLEKPAEVNAKILQFLLS